MRIKLTLFLLIALAISRAVSSEIHIYVSPKGADKNNGNSTTTAVKTLQHAVDLAGQYADKSTVKYIELMAGYYDLKQTLNITQDKLVIRAYNSQEVHVTGGQRIPSSLFKHVTDLSVLTRLPLTSRDHVRVAHLPDIGITNYGVMGEYGFNILRTAPLEVFYNGKPLQFSRWPDEGFIDVVEVPDGRDGLTFRYNSTVPQTWKNESDIWVYGFWDKGWLDRAAKVKAINVSSETVVLTKPMYHGMHAGHYVTPGVRGPNHGGFFRFVNILSALDQPGEYYMDREHGNLYAWMPNTDGHVNATDIIYVSMIENCIQLGQHVTDVIIEGFTLEVCRNFGITGTNVNNIKISRMEIRNTGSVAVLFDGDSRNCLVNLCYIHDTDGGIFMNGGNRKTLESSGHTIENNEIYRYARVGAVGKHAVSATGMGHVIRYNHIYFGQYTAVWYMGNDILMEYNLIHHVCMNSTDCGALHTGRDWTTRGNIIRHNIIHHTVRLLPGAGCRGVMLDDQSSSTTISNNVFHNNDIHTNIGGGRDNIIENNVMYNATSYSIGVDFRGNRHGNDGALIRRLNGVPFNGTAWSFRYPEMASFTLKNAYLPEGNQIRKNIIFNKVHVQFVLGLSRDFNNTPFFNISDTGYSVGKADHYNVDIGDYRIKCHAAEWANRVSFRQVPSPNDVGPTAPVGPKYLSRGIVNRVNLNSSSNVCTTHAPAADSPMPAYLPDGSRENDLFNTSKEGCWLNVAKCTDHPSDIGTYRDTAGERDFHAADNETTCFRRAVAKWRHCGSHKNEQVAAIYGPTGATTLAGDGCFMAKYGCPKHGGPADGHVLTTGRINRDYWAEQHVNGSYDEKECLARALGTWGFCGASKNHPITSIFRPTGAIVTAGAGCWIHVQKCPNHPSTKSMFYDALGATNYHTDDMEGACLQRAEYYWKWCGSNSAYPVTAFYRPSTASKIFPSA